MTPHEVYRLMGLKARRMVRGVERVEWGRECGDGDKVRGRGRARGRG
jgi:hypothetical protein